MEGLRLCRCTRVLTVVGELISETCRSNGIGVDDRGATTSNESPDATIMVENGKLQRSTSLSIQLSNVSLFLGKFATERCRELDRRASIDVDLVPCGCDSGNPQVGW